ncbi:ABC transporter ATP-binding protein [Treponema brennaborense]|uniref:Xenobiotic-transporting ATPase n=1 Tax=Treponema brennaborense (strain DSM 12168 / CIP 105900 / DD5/3) TaxID=906968 RepID=F4LII6_TREBD|nr:ABC transporter ATP-binding protein [Treponema brennaborense]AEE17211.1 Xenobiotic-transporting ATPase [Treponema brennaborense DSM 12168]
MTTLTKLVGGLEKKYKIYTVLTPLAMIGEVAMEVLIPLIMANIIDTGITNRDINYVVRTGVLMIGAACFSLLCGVLSGWFAALASTGFSHNLRRKLFGKVQDFAFSNMDKFGTASMVTRLTTDVTNTQNTYQMIIRICVRAPVMLISATIMACFINLKLASLFFIVIPILAIGLVLIGIKAFPRFREMLKKYDRLNSDVQENLNGIRVVKSFVRESYEEDKFRKTADEVRTAQVKAERIIIFGMPLMQIMMYVCIIAVLWFGGNMIIGGTMQTGELISFVTYITQILMSLMMISMIFVMLVLSKASIGRILEVLDETPDITDPLPVKADAGTDASAAPEAATTPQAADIGDGTVEFRGVSFSYAKNAALPVLDRISLTIPAGVVAGIIGGTGSSKSTLVQMIPRLYDATAGSVLVGGKDVRTLPLEKLRNAVAMVLQKNVLFSGTISENLRWGNERATDGQIKAACTAADAAGFIESFPDGYETVLGQGGVNLSGGQKQRLCIARALLKEPKILILDDSTSAVDTATDARIRSALRKSLPHTTKIIIAQRITSVKDADIIFVLDDGRLVDSGTHDSLLKSCSIYREVYESQQKGAV